LATIYYYSSQRNVMTKFGFAQIKKPTPRFWRRLGNAMAAAGAAGAALTYIADYPNASIIVAVLTIVGTFISRMFGVN